MEEKSYYLGLDIGTESVGWAVTDSQYRLEKRYGKTLWGVRLFESAKTAQERRGYRVARRRIERRRARLQWLQEAFSQEIAKVDPAFFQRLRESKFLEEDKQADFPLGRYTLFADKAYCDKDYHRQYPTIYHLRKALLQSDGAFDVRLVYLALHHIFKNRGHFLYGDVSLETITLHAGLERLTRAVEQVCEQQLLCESEQELHDILLSRTLNKAQRKKHLAQQFHVEKKDGCSYAVIELLTGAKVSLNSLYGEGTANDEIDKISLEDEFDLYEEKLVERLGDRIELILAVKEIYDWSRLETMLDGEKYLSFAKVKTYQKHESDLKRLKMVLKEHADSKLYREIFHTARKKLDNYPAYAGKGAANYRCDYDQFRKYLTGKLNSLRDSVPQTDEILEELECGTFLPRPTSKNNSIIPHQLHEMELVRILENAQKYLPFLQQTDETGLTLAQRIHQMFCFRVPYYVGPLDSRSPNSWIVRSNEKIFPWNFERVVDLEQCRRNFITRMTAKCSYIGEDVLPKDSLLYTKFMVLNELNNLTINGKEISVEQKQLLYKELFLTGKKVTQTKLRNALQLEKEDRLGGFDNEIKATLAPWKHYDWLLQRPGGFEAAEEIIRHITLFGEDRKLLRSWLHKTYGTMLSAEEERKALAFRASGWGRLSNAFLTKIFHVDKTTGEAFSILDMLWCTNDNLMELLSGKYTFAQAVEAYRRDKFSGSEMTLQNYLDESYASPGIKRAIHQVIEIAGEIEKIMKAPPKRIFVEMAREDGEKGMRTVSRKVQLETLYKKCGEESGELFQQLQSQTEGELRRDKLYLYYTQLGRCMYSGEAIDLERLDSDYDIDHIYPQSKTKDDSLRNRVLVKRQLNAAKSDTYPIDAEIRKQMIPLWAQLRKKELISKEKFDRLTRATGFTAEEQAGFIARQLVETRQSSKIVAELLQRKFGKDTEIVYVKAGNVSSFRHDQRLTADGDRMQAGQCKGIHTIQDPLFVKCREINVFHHAKDAYLNIVAGNVYYVKFTCNPANFIRQKDARYSLNRMFDFDVERGGERAWTAGETGSIAVVRRTMGKNNILLTRRASEAGGGLFDQLIVPKNKGQTSIKTSEPRMTVEKYGGYNKLTGAYFILVEHTKKKKRVRSLETVFLLHRALYEQDAQRYCREILELDEPVILLDKVRIDSLLSFDGFRMHISGRTNNQISFKNANPLVVDDVWHQYVKNIAKYLERCKSAKADLPITRYDGLTAEQNVQFYQLLLEKLENRLYRIRLETAAGTVREQQEKFGTLTVPDQCRILMQLLNLFADNAASADLKLLNGKAGIGKLLISKNLDNYQGHELKLIHQSVTGVFEKQIDLLAEVAQ